MASTITFTWNGPAVTAAVNQAASRGVFRSANLLRNEVIRLILNTTKTGRVYAGHQASAPGEPPASDTGQLVQGIRVEFSPGSLSASVVSGDRKATMLEFGTSRMAARPSMVPAFVNKRDEMFATITRELNGALK